MLYPPQVQDTAAGRLAVLKYLCTDIRIDGFDTFRCSLEFQLQRWAFCLHFRFSVTPSRKAGKGRESPTIVGAAAGFCPRAGREHNLGSRTISTKVLSVLAQPRVENKEATRSHGAVPNDTVSLHFK